MAVIDLRRRVLTDALPDPDEAYVLYWMTAYRRATHNHALDRALELCRETGKPLLVLEGLRAGYRWASDRMHAFATHGMADNAAAFAAAGVTYHAYLEPEPGHGQGLLEALAAKAAAVVTDDYPAFFLPRMLEAAADRLEDAHVAFEAIDGNGLYPIRDTDRIFTMAHSFRRHLQKRLPKYLDGAPAATPLAGYDLGPAELPPAVRERWPAADLGNVDLGAFPIDHSVSPGEEQGGSVAAEARLQRWLERRFSRYGDDRNHPDDTAASGLSAHLHWGHLSPWAVFEAITARESWAPERIAAKPNGKREGWWNMGPAAEAFLDELVTWREIGFNMAALSPRFTEYESLPEWAQKTLAEHEGDERPYLYTHAQLEGAETHDEIWNAAQRELVRTGRMHNYLRMLWGKKIL
ncbi:MAG: deoxyribodipyrimidine photo-lyase, partial [Myxococcota bacterium]